MTTRYYALTGIQRTAEDPYSVFRESRGVTEVWDRETKEWRFERSLATYIMDGEVGAVEISKGAADRVIKELAKPAGG